MDFHPRHNVATIHCCDVHLPFQVERPFAKQQALGYTSNGGPLQGRRKTYPTPTGSSENHRLQNIGLLGDMIVPKNLYFLGWLGVLGWNQAPVLRAPCLTLLDVFVSIT